MEDLQDENAGIQEDLPRLQEQIEELEQKLASEKRKTEIIELHKQCDLANLGMKVVVQKLNGDPKSKFEVDHKMSAAQFYKFIC